MNSHTKPIGWSRRALWALPAFGLGLALSAGPCLGTVWATSADGCTAAGFNTATQATGGQYAGLWRCTNTSAGPDPYTDLFPLQVLLDINAFVNSTPDFESTTLDIGGETYALQAGEEEGVRVINVSAQGVLAGAFGEGPFTGSVETTEINLNGSGDPTGGRYHTYSGVVTSPPWCDRDIDGDGDTDVLDFGLFAAQFGQAVSPGVVPDFDGDGTISVIDFGLFVADFGCTN